MNKTFKKITLLFCAFAIMVLAASCYIPSPLYGTWADGNGREKIIFMDDGTFSATIINSDDTTSEYTGEWSTVDNILVLNIKGSVNYSRNCPWDLHGAILYITWNGDSGENAKTLTLYHVAR